MKKIVLAGALLLTACAELPLAVSDYNGASVKIRQSTMMTAPDPDDPAVVSEARRICGSTGKRAEYASSIVAPNAYYSEHLFLCL